MNNYKPQMTLGQQVWNYAKYLPVLSAIEFIRPNFASVNRVNGLPWVNYELPLPKALDELLEKIREGCEKGNDWISAKTMLKYMSKLFFHAIYAATTVSLLMHGIAEYRQYGEFSPIQRYLRHGKPRQEVLLKSQPEQERRNELYLEQVIESDDVMSRETN